MKYRYHLPRIQSRNANNFEAEEKKHLLNVDYALNSILSKEL